MTITQTIAYYCETRRISARRLAEQTGLPLRRVAAALYGRREFEPIEYVRVCDALGVSLDFFAKLSRELRNDKA